MSHSKLRLLLNDYVDRELRGTDRSEVSAHLSECDECALEVREIERTVSLLRRLPEPELPPAFAETVIERVRAGESTPAWRRTLLGILQPAFTVTATAAVAGLAVFAVVRGNPTGDVPSSALETASVERPARAPQAATLPQLGPAPMRTPAIAASATRPTPLPKSGGSAGELVASQMQGQRRALELQRQSMARTLRGAGHPHSAILAAHFEDRQDQIQLIAAPGDLKSRVLGR